ncbi:MAG: hypothetical protein ACI865_000028 [Flavobacteriaceae bacterium]|jgi:hypothetical protein
MKPIISFILILSITLISSCGYNRIRYTKAISTPTEERSQTIKDQRNSDLINDNVEVPSSLNENIRAEEITVESSENEPTIFSVEHLLPNEQPSDTMEAADAIPEDVVYRALRAEKNATAATVLFITGTVGLVFIAFFAFIITGVGLFLYIRSKRSRFITERGERQLRKAKIALIVNLVVILLLTILIAGLIFLL